MDKNKLFLSFGFFLLFGSILCAIYVSALSSSDFIYWRNIFINDNVSYNQSNFPFILNNSYFNASYFGNFMVGYNNLTQIPCEVVTYSNTTSEIYCKPYNLTFNENPSNSLNIYYNKTGVPTSYNSSDVWTNYSAVWHFNNLIDSKGISNATLMGSPIHLDTIGLFGQGYSFTNINQAISLGGIGTNTPTNPSNNSFSIGIWVFTNNTIGESQPWEKFIIGTWKAGSTPSPKWVLQFYDGNIITEWNGITGDSITYPSTSGINYADNQWHYIVLTKSNASATNNVKLYIDGNLSLQYSRNQWSSMNPLENLTIGNREDLSMNVNPPNTNFTEIRIAMTEWTQQEINSTYQQGIRSFANLNNTESNNTWMFISDPNIYLISPSNNSLSGATKEFTCNSTDAIKLSNITFFVWNSTNALINQTIFNITGLSNSTSVNISFTNNGTHFWNCEVYNNNSLLSRATLNNTLIVDTSNPLVTQNFPTNNKFLNYKTNVDFNCTVEGENVSSVFLYGNFSGNYLLNKTINGITSGSVNNFQLNLTEQSFKYTCVANRTIDNTLTFSQQGNYTFTIDLTSPKFYNISTKTTLGSQTLSFNSTEVDTFISSCKYSVYKNVTTIDGLNNNVSFTCNTQEIPVTVSAYGTYNLTLYSNDSAGNENSTNYQFTVSASPPTSTGSGGGGGSENKARVVALIKPSGIIASYTSLQRAIIFAKMRNYTSNGDFPSSKTQELIDSLKLNSITLTNPELWIKQYSDKQYEVVEVTESQQQQYDLVKSELVFGSEFKISPSLIDTYFFASICDENDTYNWNYQVKSSKIMSNCSAIEGRFKCNITSPSVAELGYPLKYSSERIYNLDGRIRYFSSDGEVAETKIQSLHVINSCVKLNLSSIGIEKPVYTSIYLIGILALLITGSASFFAYKSLRKSRKQSLNISNYFK